MSHGYDKELMNHIDNTRQINLMSAAWTGTQTGLPGLKKHVTLTVTQPVSLLYTAITPVNTPVNDSQQHNQDICSIFNI